MGIMDLFKKEEPKKEEGPKVEDKIFNPLNAACGRFVELTTFEETKTFEITEMSEFERNISRETFKFTDYQIEDGPVMKIIRVNPGSTYDPKSSAVLKGADTLLLKLLYSGEFDEGIQDAVRCQEFYNNIDENTRITYYSLKAGREGFSANLRTVKKNDPNVKYNSIKYWDFFRKPDPSKGEFNSDDIFLFVEIDQTDGFINMWEGSKLSEGEIKIY